MSYADDLRRHADLKVPMGPIVRQDLRVAALYIEQLEAKVERLELRIAELERAIEAVVVELDGDHRPYDPRTNTEVSPGFHRTNAKLGCVVCWPTDGSWPCSTAMAADELRDLVAAETCE